MKKQKTGFTLVELIIVITILSILSTLAFVGYQNYSLSSRDANRLSTVNTIHKGLEVFQVKTSFYPSPDEVTGTGSFGGVVLHTVGKIGTSVTTAINMSTIPKDPSSQEKYVYGVSVDKKYVQIATVVEGDLATTLSLTTYADGAQARVVGNYGGLLRLGNVVYNLPSLIFLSGGSIVYPGQDPYFVINKGQNIPYALSGSGVQKTQTLSGVLQELTGTSSTVFTGITLPSTLSRATLLANSGTYAQLGYPLDTIGQTILGRDYFAGVQTSIQAGAPVAPPPSNSCATPPSGAGVATTVPGSPTMSNQVWQSTNAGNPCYYTCNANYSGTNCVTYTPPGPPTFLANCTSASSVGGIIYTDATGTEIGRVSNTGSTMSGNPNTLTCAGHIIVCSGNNAGYVLQACNAGATTVYTNQTFDSVNTPRTSILNTWAGGLYQWGRNEDISLGAFVSSPYNGVLTNGNVGNTNIYAGDPSYADWWQTEAGNSSPSRWAGSNVQGPCPTGYHIPTGGGGEWQNIYTAGGWLSDQGTAWSTSLRLPISGIRYGNNGIWNSQGMFAYYWSTNANGTFAHLLSFGSNFISPGSSATRDSGGSLRCLKN